eukprot:jgi/Galph1/6109/GphlegSOOS_G4642.1
MWCRSRATTILQQFRRYSDNISLNKERFLKFLNELESHRSGNSVGIGKSIETVEERSVPQFAARSNLSRGDAFEVVNFIVGMNAVDPCLLDVRGKCSFADYMIVTSGRNSAHLSFMARKLAKEMAALPFYANRRTRPIIYGRNRTDWIAVDCGRLIVHYMLQTTREQYNLEQLWQEEDDLHENR